MLESLSEDLEPLGLTWLKLGLNDVLYDPKTKTVYTPNTDKTSTMGESAPEGLPEGGNDDTIEKRAGQARDKKGRFASTGSTSLKGLVGKKTSDGRTVKSINPHAQRRAKEKNIYAHNVLNSLQKSKPTKGGKPNTLVYQYNKTRVVYNTKHNQVVTVIYKD